MFREMHGVRNFRFVFCVEVLDCIAERAEKRLKHAVKDEERWKGLDFSIYGSSITREMWTHRTHQPTPHARWSPHVPVPATVL